MGECPRHRSGPSPAASQPRTSACSWTWPGTALRPSSRSRARSCPNQEHDETLDAKPWSSVRWDDYGDLVLTLRLPAREGGGGARGAGAVPGGGADRA